MQLNTKQPCTIPAELQLGKIQSENPHLSNLARAASTLKQDLGPLTTLLLMVRLEVQPPGLIYRQALQNGW